MSTSNIIILAILIAFMAINLIVGITYSRREAKIQEGTGFLNKYFVGGRSLGGLVLAMTVAATFASASSFIGGPGIAYSKGLVWILISVIQVPTTFLVLAILGKKFALISRRTNAVTIADYLRTRFESSTVVILASVAMIAFFITQMISQFIGGAVLIESITGLPYKTALLIFALAVIIYTAFGGFKAVAINDTIQGFIMVIGCFLILFTIINVAGGWDTMIDKINIANPTWINLDPDGATPKPYILSFWVLVGIGVMGLPQTAIRGMTFKDTKAMHSAIVYGTIVVTILMLLMHMAGAFAPSIIGTEDLPTSDYLVPALVLKYMNPVVAGLFIAAPLSAIMSTVAALLLIASSSLVKDLYLNYIAKEKITGGKGTPEFERKISRLSMGVTFVLGVIVVILALNPPDLIIWINLFAMGGLECTFLLPIVGGIFWKQANTTGVLLSIFGSLAVYIAVKMTGFSILGLDAVVLAIVASLILFVVGSLFGKKPRQEVLDLYYS